MKQPLIIAPSILSADFCRLGQEVEDVLAAGADWIHFDVMDNLYVPNLTIGPLVCDSLRKAGVKAPIDVHLMVEKPENIVPQFIKAGASSITFHPDATRHVDRLLGSIQDEGVQSGLVLNPATPIQCIENVLDKIDILLLMTVNPGFGGQSFISSQLDKIKAARAMIDDSGHSIRLAVDGGIDATTAPLVKDAGADTIIAGSAIFNQANYEQAVNALKA